MQSLGYSRAAYFISKNLTLLWQTALTPLGVSLAVTAFVNPGHSVFVLYGVIFCLQWATHGLGFLIIAAMETSSNTQMVCICVVVVCKLISGGSPSLAELKDNETVATIIALSPQRWAQEALMLLTIKGMGGIAVAGSGNPMSLFLALGIACQQNNLIHLNEPYCGSLVNGQYWRAIYGYSDKDDGVSVAIGMLLLLGVVWRLAAFLLSLRVRAL